MGVNTQINAHIELRWRPSFLASCLHAAEALARGAVLVDGPMSDAVGLAARDLRHAIHAADLPRLPFWRNLVGLSAQLDNLGELAERAVVRTVGGGIRSESIATQVAAILADLAASVRRARPDLVDELSLRGRPLRDQWEARGPGLLRGIARCTDERLLVPQADVILVYPALGGGGSAHLPFNAVRMEAVVTDPVPELPEVVRLGWLLAQLNLELPLFSDPIAADRLPHIAELALLPPTLQSAANVELAQLDRPTLELALRTWRIVTPGDLDAVDVLTRWWDTCQATHPRWEVAFTALDRMFG